MGNPQCPVRAKQPLCADPSGDLIPFLALVLRLWCIRRRVDGAKGGGVEVVVIEGGLWGVLAVCFSGVDVDAG